jgi:anti-sigma factor RsiW
MSDADGRSPAPLALQALLYAAGELPAAEADAFEQRLADDQAAREALVQAVAIVQPLSGGVPGQPRPAYREVVRRRLQPRANLWRRLLGQRAYPGHPLLWAGLGAAAAALVLVLVLPPPPSPIVAVGDPPSPPPVEEPLAPPEEDPAAFDVARVWATIPQGDHLVRARDDELRRKDRAEDRPRPGRTNERRERPLGNMNSQPKH